VLLVGGPWFVIWQKIGTGEASLLRVYTPVPNCVSQQWPGFPDEVDGKRNQFPRQRITCFFSTAGYDPGNSAIILLMTT
jgi:hypothetical protein